MSVVTTTAQEAGTSGKTTLTRPAILQIPFLFITTGLIAYLVLQGYIWIHAEVFSGVMRSPAGWSLAHLGALGWASMIAMGAIYQLIHVVLQRKIFSEVLGYLHYLTYTLGVIGMITGFSGFRRDLLIVGALLVTAGIVFFVFNLLATLLEAKVWNSITASVLISMLSLLLTAVTGAMMGIDFRFGWFAAFHEQLFASHLWLGALGWFGILIVGFSFKLLPMFLLAHGYDTRIEKWIIGLMAGGMLGMTLSIILLPVPLWLLLSLFAITSGFILYTLHVRSMWQRRHKKTPGAGMLSAIWVIMATAVFFLAVTVLLALWPQLWYQESFVRGAIYFYLVLWVNGSILCYLSKIIPFLWWTEKYSSQLGKPGVPALAELLKEKHYPYALRSVLVLQTVYALLMMAGYASYVSWLQGLMALGATIYAGQLLYVFRK